MVRATVFLAGFMLASFFLPVVMEHHARAEAIELAWCSSSGREASAINVLMLHCQACPVFLVGLVLMILGAFARFGRSLPLSVNAR